MKTVPRIGRILDLVGLLFFLAGSGTALRAWTGFREVQSYVPPPDAPAFSAVALADEYRRLQHIGVGLMLLGVAVFVYAWWTAGRTTPGSPALKPPRSET